MNENDSDKKPGKSTSDYVSMIENPYGINTIEISEAQQLNTELDLDDDYQAADLAPDADLVNDAASWIPDAPLVDAADDDIMLAPLELNQDTSQLDNLVKAIAEEETRRAAEVAALVDEPSAEEDRALELAKQIAEDQALNEQLLKEAAEVEAMLEMDPELLAALPKEPKVDENGNLDLSELQSCIETLLFMTDKPASLAKLKEWLGPNFNDDLFQQALMGLQTRYSASHHGFELVQVANAWQFRTKPGRAALAKRLAKVQTQRLSSGGMETLAIVAYRQPVMKEEIDKIRGVDSSYFVRGLLEKKLITITGRSELPGRPMLYSTTDSFLELFSIKDLASLPSLRELEQMIPASQSKNPEDEDPRVKEMRRLVGQMKADTSTTLQYDPQEDEKILREIRERIGSIQTSTPYLDEQKAQEKAAKEAASEAAKAENQPLGTQLPLETELPSTDPV